MREQDRHFLSSLLIAVGVIFAWKGLWNGIYEIPSLGRFNDITISWVILFIGLTMLTVSGLIFREFDPFGSVEKSIHEALLHVHKHPEKRHFMIKYYDQLKKQDVLVQGDRITGVEKDFVVVKHEKKKQEVFIPAYKVKEVLHKGKSHWRL